MEIKNLAILIFFLIFSLSCSKEYSSVNPETVYKKDISVIFEGKEFVGMAVLPGQASYDLHIKAKGDLDLFTFTNCHREEVSEDAWNVQETKRTFIFKKQVDKKKEIKLTFRPTELEKDGPCPIFVAGYEESKGRHSWAFIDFENEENRLISEVQCNGETKMFTGVSVCQARAGLLQRIKFSVNVKTSPDCPIRIINDFEYEIEIPLGECVYTFMSESGETHRLTTFGYEQVLIRK